jgi:DNA-binding MarR family transcriptional regulator
MDKSDRRKILVRITDAGREKAELDRSEISARLEKVFRQLGGQNTAEFIRLTERFLQLSPKFNHE